MPMIPTKITVQCPRDSKAVDVKETCQGEPHCPCYKHVTYRDLRMYFVCSFGEVPGREECILQDPANKELDEMEEESLEVVM